MAKTYNQKPMGFTVLLGVALCIGGCTATGGAGGTCAQTAAACNAGPGGNGTISPTTNVNPNVKLTPAP